MDKKRKKPRKLSVRFPLSKRAPKIIQPKKGKGVKYNRREQKRWRDTLRSTQLLLIARRMRLLHF
jgi:hypothetical protein